MKSYFTRLLLSDMDRQLISIIIDIISFLLVAFLTCCFFLTESYLLAFCESDRKTELLQFLEVLGIKKISSLKYVKSIFKSLGRLKLESFAERFLLELKVIGSMHSVSPPH